MSNVKMMKVDKNKFYAELKKVGHNGKTLSVSLGYAPNYIASSLHRGELRLSVAKSIEAIYHIPPDLYEFKAPEKKEAPKEAPVFNADQVVEELKALNGTSELNGKTLDDLLEVLIDISTELTTIRAYLLDEYRTKWTKPEEGVE